LLFRGRFGVCWLIGIFAESEVLRLDVNEIEDFKSSIIA